MYQARRLEIIGTLARYLVAREPGTEIPLRGLLGPAHARRPAFLYSAAHLSALLQAARTLTPTDGLRPRTYATLIGLLACTGLRIAEALALRVGDLDWGTQVLTVRQTKFHKSRLVPLHPSAVAPLRDYARARDNSRASRPDIPFFASAKGGPLLYGTVRSTFHRLLRLAMPEVKPVGRVRPRFHDLRHTFACRRLLDWYGNGTDIDQAIDQLSALLGSRQSNRHLLVSDRCPGTPGPGRPALRAIQSSLDRRAIMSPTFDILIQDFFCRRLIQQQGVSPRTVEAYRDTFRLLLAYLPQRLRKPVPAIALVDLDAPVVLAFLDHLENERGNGPRTRNARLTALRSFVQYAASRDPTAWPLAHRVLAIPAKRFTRPMLGYLSREEMQAVLDAPDATTWSGQRDRVLFAVMYNTGARVSEAVGMNRADVTDGQTRSVRIRGKGRKERLVPLWKQTTATLGSWLKRLASVPESPLFPNARGQKLTRDRGRGPLDERCLQGQHGLSEPTREGSLTSHPPAHDSDALVAIGRGSDGHRPVAGSREPRDDTPVHRGRSAHEGGSAGEDAGNLPQANALPTQGKTAGVPRPAMTELGGVEGLRMADKSGMSGPRLRLIRNSAYLRPMAIRFISRSATLLSIARKPASVERTNAVQLCNAEPIAWLNGCFGQSSWRCSRSHCCNRSPGPGAAQGVPIRCGGRAGSRGVRPWTSSVNSGAANPSPWPSRRKPLADPPTATGVPPTPTRGYYALNKYVPFYSLVSPSS